MRIGIDLGGTKTEGILMNNVGEIVTRQRQVTPQKQGYSAIISNVISLINSLESGLVNNCKIGVCAPGALSTRDGCVKNSNTVCLNGKPFKTDLENALGREIRMENDANCFTLSEATNGAGADYNVVFGVIMGTGVGGGITVNKQLLSGQHHIAGEWGHNVLHADGPRCYCGKRGCVETYLSGPGLLANYHACGGSNANSCKDFVKLVNEDSTDAVAEQTFASFLDNFGRALSVVVNILDPDAIILGGGLSNIDQLYEQGVDRLTQYVFNDEYKGKVLHNHYGDSSGVRGAAWLWP